MRRAHRSGLGDRVASALKAPKSEGVNSTSTGPESLVANYNSKCKCDKAVRLRGRGSITTMMENLGMHNDSTVLPYQ